MSLPRPPYAWSSPRPPFTRSRSGPPLTTSSPLSPSTRSLPPPPYARSAPVPPITSSRPLPPQSRSLPPPPRRMSFAPRPRSRSFPPSPQITSRPRVPTRTSWCAVPVIVQGTFAPAPTAVTTMEANPSARLAMRTRRMIPPSRLNAPGRGWPPPSHSLVRWVKRRPHERKPGAVSGPRSSMASLERCSALSDHLDLRLDHVGRRGAGRRGDRQLLDGSDLGRRLDLDDDLDRLRRTARGEILELVGAIDDLLRHVLLADVVLDGEALRALVALDRDGVRRVPVVLNRDVEGLGLIEFGLATLRLALAGGVVDVVTDHLDDLARRADPAVGLVRRDCERRRHRPRLIHGHDTGRQASAVTGPSDEHRVDVRRGRQRDAGVVVESGRAGRTTVDARRARRDRPGARAVRRHIQRLGLQRERRGHRARSVHRHDAVART